MKIGIMLETKEPEKAWNAFRFGMNALSSYHEVRVFLMGEAVEVEGVTEEPYNAAGQMQMFLDNGGSVLACGTCLKSRHLEEKTVCPVSSMQDMTDMVVWADKVVSF